MTSRSELALQIDIPWKLPSMNDIIGSAKSCGGLAYSRLKKDWTKRIARVFTEEQVPPFESAVVTIRCFELSGSRRDEDGIISGASKLILDAMTKAGVIKTDGRKHISLRLPPVVYGDSQKTVVEIEEKKKMAKPKKQMEAFEEKTEADESGEPEVADVAAEPVAGKKRVRKSVEERIAEIQRSNSGVIARLEDQERVAMARLENIRSRLAMARAVGG